MDSVLWGLKTPNTKLCPGWSCFGNWGGGGVDINTKMPSYLGALPIDSF